MKQTWREIARGRIVWLTPPVDDSVTGLHVVGYDAEQQLPEWLSDALAERAGE